MSEIRANTVSNAAGTGPATLTGQYAAKAWVNFDGTGTVAIRESGNVSSITDLSTGRYVINFTNAMADTNYSVVGFAGQSTSASSNFVTSGTNGVANNVGYTDVKAGDYTSVSRDTSYITVNVLR